MTLGMTKYPLRTALSLVSGSLAITLREYLPGDIFLLSNLPDEPKEEDKVPQPNGMPTRLCM